MSGKKQEPSADSPPSGNPGAPVENEPQSSTRDDSKPVEIGGWNGPDPVRYGDWEKGGRCIDF